MNINPQASSSIEYSSPDQLGRVEKLGLDKNPNNNNWQFRKMRPTCFGDHKNTPAGPSSFWRKKDDEPAPTT